MSRLSSILLVTLVVGASVSPSPVAAEPPTSTEAAAQSLAGVAAWFESLPDAEKAEAARALRAFAASTYGDAPPFPFAWPTEEQIAAWRARAGEQAEESERVAEAPEPPESTAPEPAAPGPAASEPPEPTASEPPEPTAPEPTAPEPTAPEPAAPEPAPTAPQVRSGPRCQTLAPFDTDEDGKITALDRYWRHFYLWTDSDGDGKPADGEMTSPYERKIREIDLDLRSFVQGKEKRARRLEIQDEEYLLLDTDGDGFSGSLLPRRDDHALAVDADALRRGSQALDLRDAQGRQVVGIQPFARGWTITDAAGAVVHVDCPD